MRWATSHIVRNMMAFVLTEVVWQYFSSSIGSRSLWDARSTSNKSWKLYRILRSTFTWEQSCMGCIGQTYNHTSHSMGILCWILRVLDSIILQCIQGGYDICRWIRGRLRGTRRRGLLSRARGVSRLTLPGKHQRFFSPACVGSSR